MIKVIETETGFERIGGNPTLLSLDGTRKARLAVVMHESWTDEQRAAFGIYVAEPFVMPDGKQAAGAESFERVEGKVVQVVPVEDAPDTEPSFDKLGEIRLEIAELAKRVAALEVAQ